MTARTTELGEALEALLGNRFENLRAVDIGEVASWSKGVGTADIQPVILGAGNAPRSEIPRCAVIFPGLYWDLQVGERGLLLVCDRDYRRFWRQNEASVARTTAAHQIGSSVFLPGFTTQTEASFPARSIPADAKIVEKPTAGGTVRLGDSSATKPVMDGDAFHTAMTAWVAVVRTQILAAGGGDIGAANTTLLNAISAALSSVVKIEV